jgi:ADP-L-glycero-D-manno-heptose 6-epimerase
MIAITGAAGFIGSVLAWRLNQLGHKDLLLVDQKAKNSPKWNNVKKRQFDIYLESDEFIKGLESKQITAKIDAIFHLGACSDTTEMDRNYLRENNTEYSERLAQWALANGAYFAYASSAATYGDGEMGFSDDDMLTPKLSPLNPYGQSKLDFDRWVLNHHFQNKVTGFRYFNVYGPNEYHKGHMRSMVQKGFEQVMKEGKLRLFKSYRPEYPDGGQKRDFIYVKDTVEAMLWFYRNPKIKGIYNLGSGKAQSWNELAEAIFKACGKPKNIEYIEMPENLRNQYQYFTEADLKKLREVGCTTKFQALDGAVKDYVQTHLLQKDAYL